MAKTLKGQDVVWVVFKRKDGVVMLDSIWEARPAAQMTVGMRLEEGFDAAYEPVTMREDNENRDMSKLNWTLARKEN
jgi:hypothetical protein